MDSSSPPPDLAAAAEALLASGLTPKQAGLALRLRRFEEFRVEQERRLDAEDAQVRAAALEARRARVAAGQAASAARRATLNGFMAHLSDAHQVQMARIRQLRRRQEERAAAVGAAAEAAAGEAADARQRAWLDAAAWHERALQQRRYQLVTAHGGWSGIDEFALRSPPAASAAGAPADPSDVLTRLLADPHRPPDAGVTASASRRRRRAASLGLVPSAPHRVSLDALSGHARELAASLAAAYDPVRSAEFAAALRGRVAARRQAVLDRRADELQALAPREGEDSGGQPPPGGGVAESACVAGAAAAADATAVAPPPATPEPTAAPPPPAPPFTFPCPSWVPLRRRPPPVVALPSAGGAGEEVDFHAWQSAIGDGDDDDRRCAGSGGPRDATAVGPAGAVGPRLPPCPSPAPDGLLPAEALWAQATGGGGGGAGGAAGEPLRGDTAVPCPAPTTTPTAAALPGCATLCVGDAAALVDAVLASSAEAAAAGLRCTGPPPPSRGALPRPLRIAVTRGRGGGADCGGALPAGGAAAHAVELRLAARLRLARVTPAHVALAAADCLLAAVVAVAPTAEAAAALPPELRGACDLLGGSVRRACAALVAAEEAGGEAPAEVAALTAAVRAAAAASGAEARSGDADSPAAALCAFALHFAAAAAAADGALRGCLQAAEAATVPPPVGAPGATPPPEAAAAAPPPPVDEQGGGALALPADALAAALAAAALPSVDAAAGSLVASLQQAQRAAVGGVTLQRTEGGAGATCAEGPPAAAVLPPQLLSCLLPVPGGAPPAGEERAGTATSLLATLVHGRAFSAALAAHLRLCEQLCTAGAGAAGGCAEGATLDGYCLAGGLPCVPLHVLAVEHAAGPHGGVLWVGCGDDAGSGDGSAPGSAARASHFAPPGWDGRFASLADAFTSGGWRPPRCGPEAARAHRALCDAADASAAAGGAAVDATTKRGGRSGPGPTPPVCVRPTAPPPAACALAAVVDLRAAEGLAAAPSTPLPPPTATFVEALVGCAVRPSRVEQWPAPLPPPAPPLAPAAAPPPGGTTSAGRAAPKKAAAAAAAPPAGGGDAPGGAKKAAPAGKGAPAAAPPPAPPPDPVGELLGALGGGCQPCVGGWALLRAVVPHPADAGSAVAVTAPAAAPVPPARAAGAPPPPSVLASITQWCAEGCALGTVSVPVGDAATVTACAGAVERALLTRAGDSSPPCGPPAGDAACALQAVAHGWQPDVAALAALRRGWGAATAGYERAVSAALREAHDATRALAAGRQARLARVAAALGGGGPATDGVAAAALPPGVATTTLAALGLDSAASMERRAQALRRVAAARGVPLQAAARGPHRGELRSYVVPPGGAAAAAGGGGCDTGWTNDDLLAVAAEVAGAAAAGAVAEASVRAAALCDAARDACMALFDALRGAHASAVAAAAAVAAEDARDAAACGQAWARSAAALDAAQAARWADCAAALSAVDARLTQPARAYLARLEGISADAVAPAVPEDGGGGDAALPVCCREGGDDRGCEADGTQPPPSCGPTAAARVAAAQLQVEAESAAWSAALTVGVGGWWEGAVAGVTRQAAALREGLRGGGGGARLSPGAFLARVPPLCVCPSRGCEGGGGGAG